MKVKRKGDFRMEARFRSERMYKYNNKWFFCTREGALQGPFQDQFEANYELKMYLDAMASDLVGELSPEMLEAFGSEYLDVGTLVGLCVPPTAS